MSTTAEGRFERARQVGLAAALVGAAVVVGFGVVTLGRDLAVREPYGTAAVLTSVATALFSGAVALTLLLEARGRLDLGRPAAAWPALVGLPGVGLVPAVVATRTDVVAVVVVTSVGALLGTAGAALLLVVE